MPTLNCNYPAKHLSPAKSGGGSSGPRLLPAVASAIRLWLLAVAGVAPLPLAISLALTTALALQLSDSPLAGRGTGMKARTLILTGAFRGVGAGVTKTFLEREIIFEVAAKQRVEKTSQEKSWQRRVLQ
jgi:hypothetical protein